MIDQSDGEHSRPVESEVDRAQRNQERRRRSPWSYLVGLLAVALIVVLGVIFQHDAPEPAFRASASSASN